MRFFVTTAITSIKDHRIGYEWIALAGSPDDQIALLSRTKAETKRFVEANDALH
jgi:hypothetical protein